MTNRKSRRPLVLVNDLVPGTTVDSYFFLRAITPGGGNGPKLRARIWDRTGEVALIAWEWDERWFPTDGPYRVVGTVGTYAGSVQVCAERMEPSPPDLDMRELLPAAPRAAVVMWVEFEKLCAECANEHLRALLRLCLEDAELRDRWQSAPAGARHHHAYAGGLLEHTLGVARLALALAAHFPSLDQELLLSGALLHDIGKIEAYQVSGAPGMTDEGRLLGHVYPGVHRVDNLIARVPGFPMDLRIRLLHLIGSHHGDRQFGVLEVPKTPEAILLHYADNIDAKMYAVLAACEQSQGQIWTNPIRSLDDERVYLGAASENPIATSREGNTVDMADDPFSEGLFSQEDLDR